MGKPKVLIRKSFSKHFSLSLTLPFSYSKARDALSRLYTGFNLSTKMLANDKTGRLLLDGHIDGSEFSIQSISSGFGVLCQILHFSGGKANDWHISFQKIW